MLRVRGNPLEGNWHDSDIVERCKPERRTAIGWNYTFGTRFRNGGGKLFDYTCYYPPAGSLTPCPSIVERVYLARMTNSSE